MSSSLSIRRSQLPSRCPRRRSITRRKEDEWVCRVRVVSKDSFELLEGVMSFFLVNKTDNSSFILASKSGGCNLSA
ncbi:LOW QUALITY PROTEIN: hypothetical protein PanWU01x14_113600 [Parasponia andersonii]|uniref:Uncharacterized protein n=1 Tax=Parasponia andersonii TaxID=3476 RepID=A0A2P5CXW5_PARAD|nr:LOW QUALITY PROTEIN: hypothetical protein PanWU01x14_113600 [Parasponia andersonii]